MFSNCEREKALKRRKQKESRCQMEKHARSKIDNTTFTLDNMREKAAETQTHALLSPRTMTLDALNNNNGRNLSNLASCLHVAILFNQPFPIIQGQRLITANDATHRAASHRDLLQCLLLKRMGSSVHTHAISR